jgi:hypothetical protein
MGRRSRTKRERRRPAPPLPIAWAERDGIHALVPGEPPSAAQLAELSRRYQESIRRSPLWNEMVKRFGKERAEELLREFRAEVRSGGP